MKSKTLLIRALQRSQGLVSRTKSTALMSNNHKIITRQYLHLLSLYFSQVFPIEILKYFYENEINLTIEYIEQMFNGIYSYFQDIHTSVFTFSIHIIIIIIIPKLYSPLRDMAYELMLLSLSSTSSYTEVKDHRASLGVVCFHTYKN